MSSNNTIIPCQNQQVVLNKFLIFPNINNIMNAIIRDKALLSYIEFHLIKMVEKYEPLIDDYDLIIDMYQHAQHMLQDIEHTVAAQHVIDAVEYIPVDK